MTRREFVAGLIAGAGFLGASGFSVADDGSSAPAGPVGIGLCKSYEYRAVRRVLRKVLSQLGGVDRLVRGKHVTVKVNLVNTSREDIGGVPVWLTVTVHPVVAMALGSLVVEYGARRVTFCDQLPFRCSDEEAFAGYGFRLAEFQSAMDGRARFLNTRNRA
ncbi:MAG: hypothetical protein N3G20_02590, partial [Verrucomicrobiae bacterium]|nr:hypothetical protein [Verrucomicrobiae bacterium]